ncbi:hypothetical protein [Dactylosporangium sp. CA-139066]|uniref:hypothetical protein n=1 Tax=Dactylosporangium sp. CA-139066 TaxID=3239930 RepID=UPI003D8B2164
MRRLLSVALMAALVSGAAACEQSDDKSNSAASTGAAASASPSVDVTGNTKTVCDKAKALLTADNVRPIGEQIGLMIQARQSKNKTAETAAMAKTKELADALAQKVRGLQQEAVDPKLQAGLGKAADGVALFGTPEYLQKINSIDDMGKMSTDISAAGQDLETACNA